MTDDFKDLAAEFAMGLLTDEDHDRALELEQTDPAFRAEVARWSGRFAVFLDEIEPVDAPLESWAAIERQIGSSGRTKNVTALHISLRRWRAATAAMTAIAASLAVFLLVREIPQEPAVAPSPKIFSAPLVAALSGPQSATRVVASWSSTTRQLVIVVAGAMPSDPNRSDELWVIPPGGKPRSLGLMAANAHMHMQLADALATLLQQGATIAISVEPRGGSPTGAPTGPVVASGALTRA